MTDPFDYSQLSNEELIALAGPPSAVATRGIDLNSMSNDELIKLAGPPDLTSPTLAESSRFVGKSLLEGLLNVGKLASDYNPLNPQAAYLPGELRTSTQAQEAFDKLGLSPDSEGISGAVPDIVRSGLNSVAVPMGGAVGNFAGGVGAKLAETLFPDSIVAPIAGSIAGAGAVGAANKVAGTIKGAGQAFERSSVGALAKDYVKSQKALGLFTDEEAGEVSTKLSNAISNIAERDGLGLNRSPDALALKVSAQLKSSGNAIDEVLNEADSVGVAPNVRFLEKGSAVEKLISDSNAPKAQIKKAFNEFQDQFYDPESGWNGTVSGLNSWKSDIGDLAFSGSADGSLNPAVARRLQRAIYKDINSAVTGAVTSSGAAKSDDWSALMQKYSDYKTVAPVVGESAAKDQASTWDKAGRALLRTSGGTLTTPTVIGGALTTGALGPVAGLTAGVGLAALGTPTGRGVTGNLLKNAGRVGEFATNGSAAQSALSGLISSIYGDSNIAPAKDAPLGVSLADQFFSQYQTDSSSLLAEPDSQSSVTDRSQNQRDPAAQPSALQSDQLKREGLRSLQSLTRSQGESPLDAQSVTQQEIQSAQRSPSSPLTNEKSADTPSKSRQQKEFEQSSTSSNPLLKRTANQDRPEITNLINSLYGDTDMTEAKSKLINNLFAESVPDNLVKRVIATESSGNPNAVGPKTKYGTAKGLMQLLDSTGKEWHEKLGLPGEYDPFDKEQNRTIGTAYLGWLSEQFDGDQKLALAAYNYGIGNVKKLVNKHGESFSAIESYLPDETANYVKKIAGGKNSVTEI